MKSAIFLTLIFIGLLALTPTKKEVDPSNIYQVVLVEFYKAPNPEMILQLENMDTIKSVKRFDSYSSNYFDRLYEIQVHSHISPIRAKAALERLPFVARVDLRTFAQLSTLFPTKSKNILSNDPYSNYQWALNNQGFMIEQELSDIIKPKTYSQKHVDTGWVALQRGINGKAFDEQFKREIIVAVLDTGIDYSHPDIRDNIFKNETECDDGEIPLDAKEDRDGNGYKADCMGYDLTGTRPSQAHRPNDKIGHGTHVAGIIAAVKDNGIGISGFSNRLKILPIKVTFAGDGPNNEKTKAAAIVDRMAKGILYAIKMKADVINFSLGWPKAADIPAVREAIKEAQRQNITIVAAAGNNNHDSPIFPCSYEGVICVGSVDVDGKVSGFSNYGSQVDLLAPGDHIFSLIPIAVDSDYWHIKRGYDRKSGTSQAAPYVSAMVGALKGLNSNLSQDELYGRMMLSSWKHDQTIRLNKGDKNILGGLAYLPTSLNKIDQPVVIPNLKTLNAVTLAPNQTKFNLRFHLKNYGLKAKSVQIKVQKGSPELKILKSNFRFEDVTQGQLIPLTIPMDITDSESDSNSFITFTVQSTNQVTRKYSKSFQIQKSLKGDSRVLSFPILGKTDEKNWDLSEVPSLDDQQIFPEYYYLGRSKKGLTLKIYRKQGSQFKELSPLFFKDSIRQLSLERVDLNYDGKPDYLVRNHINPKSDKKGAYVQYSFFDKDLNPLFGKDSHWKVDVETVLLDAGDFRWIKYNLKDLGSVAVPMFINTGNIPSWDVNPDEFEFEANRPARRLYYFEPFRHKDGTIHLKTRSFDNYKIVEDLTEKLGLTFQDSLRIAEILPQSNEERVRGLIHLLVESGRQFPLTYNLIRINALEEVSQGPIKGQHHIKWSHHLIPNVETNIGFLKLEKVTGITEGLTFSHSSSFSRIELQEVAEVEWLDGTNMTHSSTFRLSDPTDSIQRFLQGFKKDGHYFSFLLSKDYINLFIEKENSKELFQKPLIRSTFLRGHLFQQSLYPIAYKSRGQLYPAIYLDSSRLTSRNLSIWAYDGKEASSPLKYSIEIPENCDPRDPGLWQGAYAYVLLCQSSNGPSLKVLPLQ